MAKVIERQAAFEQRLKRALLRGLKLAGIKARVQTEPIAGTKLHRVNVISPQFQPLRPSERQDLVWRIINQFFNHAEQLQISMIFTLTPRELRGD